VFEIDHLEVPLINISTRAQVLTGNDVVIGGFIIQGNQDKTVVSRRRAPRSSARALPMRSRIPRSRSCALRMAR